MNDVQRFLKISPIIDYSIMLKYDMKKGFYCQLIDSDHTKCLGKSKGKQYPPMEDRALKLLQRYKFISFSHLFLNLIFFSNLFHYRYYLSHNTALVKLLKKLGSRPIPQWLKNELSTTT